MLCSEVVLQFVSGECQQVMLEHLACARGAAQPVRVLLPQVGFLYLRYVGEPKDLWSWYEPYIEDEEVRVAALKQLLMRLKSCG